MSYLIEQARAVVGKQGCWTDDPEVIAFLNEGGDLCEAGTALTDYLDGKGLSRLERQVVWLLACRYFDRPDHKRSRYKDWRGRPLKES